MPLWWVAGALVARASHETGQSPLGLGTERPQPSHQHLSHVGALFIPVRHIWLNFPDHLTPHLKYYMLPKLNSVT